MNTPSLKTCKISMLAGSVELHWPFSSFPQAVAFGFDFSFGLRLHEASVSHPLYRPVHRHA